jgi:hypothetical protein
MSNGTKRLIVYAALGVGGYFLVTRVILKPKAAAVVK